MADRVDKQWKEKGLAGYSTAAIIGTLNHYGIAGDEAALGAATAEKLPLELSLDWKAAWKGTGPFATFPWAAANELVTRLHPDRPTPMKVATVLMEAVAVGLRFLAGKEGADPGSALDTFEGLAKNLPPLGDRRDAFLREFVGFLEAWARPFNELPRQLAEKGHRELALRFARTHEVLFPDRTGCATALVRAASGEKEAVQVELATWAADVARDVFARFAALDALAQLEDWAGVKAAGLDIFDLAAKEERWTMADSIAHLLAHALEASEADPAMIAEVKHRLELAHRQTGGHHHQH